MSPQSSTLIEVKNLSKTFGRNQVLSGLDIAVHHGESLAIIGASGSGKSVLLKCILGLMPIDSGQIYFDGEDVSTTGVPLIKNLGFIDQFGMLFQGGALFDSLRVWENICFVSLQKRKITKQEAIRIAIEKLELVGLKPEVAHLYPAELSGGMQKRAALARAIAADPKLLFFDEPTAGLDPISAHMISKLIAELTKNITTITITHDMRCVREIAHRIAMLRNGQIIWQGSIDDLDKPEDDYVTEFVTGG